MKIIAVEKLDITSLIESKIKQVAENNLAIQEKRNQRIEKLTPYIAQALFGMVDIHNKLIEIGSDKKVFKTPYLIQDKVSFVNSLINTESFWKDAKGTTNVSFQVSSLLIWLSDNVNCMRYTTNPIYQVYGAYDIEEFLRVQIDKYFN